MCAILLVRVLQSPPLTAQRPDGAEEASVRLRCVDPSCVRTVPRSPPAVGRG